MKVNQKELERYINQTYGVFGEHPWSDAPSHTVYRHKENKKWFALSMELPAGKIGMDGMHTVQVVNLKCEPMMIGSLLMDPGIYPGYHMNKNHWITLCLNGEVADDKIFWLLDMSFDLIGGRRKPALHKSWFRLL